MFPENASKVRPFRCKHGARHAACSVSFADAHRGARIGAWKETGPTLDIEMKTRGIGRSWTLWILTGALVDLLIGSRPQRIARGADPPAASLVVGPPLSNSVVGRFPLRGRSIWKCIVLAGIGCGATR